MSAPRLGLGTVQFGMDYGVSNVAGRPDDGELRAIMDRAARCGVTLIDTAPAYGDAAARVAACRPAAADLDVVTKTPVGTEDDVETALDRDLATLGVSAAYGVLAHRPAQLLEAGGRDLWRRLVALRDAGRTRRIGVSVYDPQVLDAVLARFPLDLVQLPFNALDQRFGHDSRLERLRDRGVEVHVRSVFLQGLLLMEPDRVPARLAELVNPLRTFQSAAARAGVTPLAAALGVVRGVAGVAAAIVGVNRAAELDAVVAAWARPLDAAAFDGLAVDDPALIDPSRWQETPA